MRATKESSLNKEEMAEYAVRKQLVQQKKVTKGASMGDKGGAWELVAGATEEIAWELVATQQRRQPEETSSHAEEGEKLLSQNRDLEPSSRTSATKLGLGHDFRS